VSPIVGGQAPGGPADLTTGITQVREGEPEAAVVTLDALVRRLSGHPEQAKELARAHTSTWQRPIPRLTSRRRLRAISSRPGRRIGA
jgi:hypothetical protein